MKDFLHTDDQDVVLLLAQKMQRIFDDTLIDKFDWLYIGPSGNGTTTSENQKRTCIICIHDNNAQQSMGQTKPVSISNHGGK